MHLIVIIMLNQYFTYKPHLPLWSRTEWCLHGVCDALWTVASVLKSSKVAWRKKVTTHWLWTWWLTYFVLLKISEDSFQKHSTLRLTGLDQTIEVAQCADVMLCVAPGGSLQYNSTAQDTHTQRLTPLSSLLNSYAFLKPLVIWLYKLNIKILVKCVV